MRQRMRGYNLLDASTLLTVGRIGGMGISRRLRGVTCQSLLTALFEDEEGYGPGGEA